MAKPQITNASLVAARQVMNEHIAAVNNPHDVNADQTGAISQEHDHTKSGLPDTCSFTRASTVWWKKKQLENNIPRIDRKLGVFIEEGTTNLLPAGAENFVTGWAEYTGASVSVEDYPVYIPEFGNIVAKRIRSTGGTAVGKYRATGSTGVNPHDITVSVWAMDLSANNNANINPNGSAIIVKIPQTMTRVSATRTASASTANYFYFYADNVADELDIVVYQPQIENKSYATSYTHPGTTRASEGLTVPASGIDAAVGFTFEIDCYIGQIGRGRTRYIFESHDSTDLNRRHVAYISSADRWMIQFGVGSTTNQIDGGAVTPGKHRIGFVAPTGGKGTFWVDGVKKGTTTGDIATTLQTLLRIGSWASATNEGNMNFSQLRISNIARSDTEMSYTGQLVPDEYTTFYNALTGQGKQIKHSNLTEIGQNTHAQIDSKISTLETKATAAETHAANAANPHSTTAIQVGAVPIGPAIITAGFNTMTTPGIYIMNAGQLDAPAATNHYWLEVIGSVGTGFRLQRATDIVTVVTHQRMYNGSTWSSWAQVYPPVYQ